MSFLNGSQEIRKINKDSYLTAHNRALNKLLDKCECDVVCDSEDPSFIYGFILHEAMGEYDVIHYVYLRKDFRGRGLAKDMIKNVKSERVNVAISHLTDDFKPARLKSIWEKAIYDCYLRIK